MAFITVHVTNLKESSEKLTKLAMSMHNFAPAMVEIGKALEHYFSTDVFYSEADPMSVFISNNARTPRGANLFAIHQLGTGSGSGRGHNIPARPMMGINEPVKSIIAQIIETDLRSKIA
jgi:phage gpG-like protein